MKFYMQQAEILVKINKNIILKKLRLHCRSVSTQRTTKHLHFHNQLKKNQFIYCIFYQSVSGKSYFLHSVAILILKKLCMVISQLNKTQQKTKPCNINHKMTYTCQPKQTRSIKLLPACGARRRWMFCLTSLMSSAFCNSLLFFNLSRKEITLPSRWWCTFSI